MRKKEERIGKSFRDRETAEKQKSTEPKNEKTRRQRREKAREPNVRGGVLTIISLVVLFFVIRTYGHSGSVLGTSDSREYELRQKEKERAEKHLQSEFEGTAKEVRGNFTEVNPVDSAVESLDKVNHDIEAAKNLPSQTVETVRNMKIGDAVTIVIESVSRLKKIISDANGVKKEALKNIEKMK